MAIETQPGQSARWLAAEFGQRLSQALESMTGDKQRSEVAPAEGANLAECLWWEQPLSVGAGASLFVGAVEQVWSAMGAGILSSAGVEATGDDAKNTYFETLSQALSAVSQSITVRIGYEASCVGSKELPGRPEITSGFFLVKIVGPAESEPATVLVGFSPQLLLALEPEPEAPLQPQPQSAQPSTALVAPEPGAVPRTLDLLLDVELPVTVSFGRAQLLLKDVIKLTSGSIVELNRAVSEPVEVIVNNCVIARGEVVVIEGNYGVRINQIISRQERLRTLK
jgi:flagellar motor switch protein FliN/FliY